MSEYVSIDFETRSTIDLRKSGVYRYAEDQTTDVWCMAYAWEGSDDVRVWRPGNDVDQELVDWINNGQTLRAWNAQFERSIWNEILHKRYSWPATSVAHWVCTAAEARAMALPGKLEDAAKVLGVEQQKDTQGANLMLRMARPRSYTSEGAPVWWDVPERILRLVSYCRQDVRTENAVCQAIRRLSADEIKVFRLDQSINDRGVQLDVRLAKAAKTLAEKASLEANRDLYDITQGKVHKATNVGKLTAWLRENGIEVDSLGKTSLRDLLAQDLPEHVLKALAVRSEAGKSSVAKIDAMLQAVCKDGRIRGLLLYHGAATGRWAGRLVQPQNFPRGTVENAERFIDLVYEKKFNEIDVEAPVLDVVSSLLRAMLVARKGHKLIAADFSAIEARVLAWLAEEELLLKTFRVNGDVYKVMASKIYGVSPDDVNKSQRQMGKQAILGLGYGMGWRKFISACDGVGITIDEDTARQVVTLYRETNAEIIEFWRELERAAVAAVEHPGTVQTVRGRLKFTKRGGYLYLVLPSGRPLCYASPKIIEKETPWGSTQFAVQFWGMDSFTRKWATHDLYGGLLAENVTQAVARDLLAEAMLRLENAGYPVVLSVHDEVVSEVPEDFGTVAEFESLMCELPPWADGCPVNAEGWEGNRFRK
jgi:DNA polymerase